MRTLIVDNETMFCETMQFMLEDLNPDMDCEIATTLTGALKKKGPFDLILLDYWFPGQSDGDSGVERMREAHKEATIVMLSGLTEPERVHELIRRGAAGFVSKESDVQTLLRALRTILKGGIYVPDFALRYVPAPQSASQHRAALASGEDADFQHSGPAHNWDEPDDDTSPSAPLRALTQRQIDCLLMAAQGKSNRVIASELFLAENTVKTHVTAAFKILGVRTRAEAVFRAASLGLLPSSARRANGSPQASR
jgi:DNA-binding NarL/FixJ family response regulator